MEDTPEIPPWIPPEPPFELPDTTPRNATQEPEEQFEEPPTETVIWCLSSIEETGGWYFILGRTLMGTTADVEWVFEPEFPHMRKDFRGITFIRYSKIKRPKS